MFSLLPVPCKSYLANYQKSAMRFATNVLLALLSFVVVLTTAAPLEPRGSF